MPSPKVLISTLAACAIAVAVVLLILVRTGSDAPTPRSAAARPSVPETQPADTKLAREKDEAPAASVDASMTRDSGASPTGLPANGDSRLDAVALSFFDSDNYLDFANMYLAHAQAGDASSQYYLGRALEDCEAWLETQAASAVGTTLGEKLESALPEPQKASLVQLHYRCVGFRDVDMSTYGSSREWLQAASDRDYGPAMSYAALDRLLLSGDRDLAEGKRLLRSALASGHPEATWHLNFIYASDVLNGGEEARVMAARLLACQQGYVCDERNLTFRQECAAGRWDCRQGNLVAAMRVTYPSADFAAIASLAVEIGAAIATNDWQALELD